jgi:hypothetical protein
MMQRPIEEWWSELDPVIQHWFAENPGCLVLPRTVANTVCEVAGSHADQDRQGRLELSPRDREFIRTQVQVISPSASHGNRKTNEEEPY